MSNSKQGPEENHYAEGVLRLIAISNRNGASCCEDRKTVKIESKRVCMACGYMWDIYEAGKKEPKRCPACSSIRWDDPDLKWHLCKQCSHRWMSRINDPVMCPGCKSKSWDTDAVRYTCAECRTSTHSSDPVLKCPRCGSNKVYSNIADAICDNCGYTGKTDTRRKGLCPVCAETLSVRTVVNGNVPIRKKNDPFPKMTREILTVLASNKDDMKKMVELTNRNDLDYTDAEILLRHRKGEDPMSIARAADVSPDRVIRIVNSIRRRVKVSAPDR